MSTLYIHIGTHKTGTTSIQAMLRSVAEDPKHSVEYINLNHHLMAKLMVLNKIDQTIIDPLKSDLVGQIKKIKEGENKQIFISNEGLCGCPRMGYENTAIAAEILKEVTDGNDVKILIYLRRQDEFAESMYTQTIHEGGVGSFNEYIRNLKRKNTFCYRNIVETNEQFFGKGNVIVRSYHAAKSEGLLNDFINAVGYQGIIETNQEIRKNRSMSKQAIAIARITNQKLSPEKRIVLRKALQKCMPKNTTDKGGYFSHDDRIEFLATYNQTNQYLSDNYIKLPREVAFPDPVCTGSETFEDHDYVESSEVSDLLVYLLNSDNKSGLSIVRKLKRLVNKYRR